MIAICAVIFMTGCQTTSISSRLDLADKIAETSSLHKHVYAAPPFEIFAYQKITRPGQDAMIYIEGDGLAWVSRSQMSMNPTPTNPVALRLATIDPNANVIYLARPCQYTKRTDGKRCDYKYWTSHRYAPDVIESYQNVLDQIKARHNVTEFQITGFSGGGAIASLLAARRNDIGTLRTVAGNVDHDALNRYHNVSLMPASLNPIDEADKLYFTPQVHYVGARDPIVIPEFSANFIKAQGSPDHATQVIVPGATHEKGWAEYWSSILYDVDS